jgi:hypothetical protein
VPSAINKGPAHPARKRPPSNSPAMISHISGAVAGLPKGADRPSSSALPGHHLAATVSAKSPDPDLFPPEETLHI